MTIAALHRGVFWEFPFRGIYYCHSNKSTGKEIGKTNPCALVCIRLHVAFLLVFILLQHSLSLVRGNGRSENLEGSQLIDWLFLLLFSFLYQQILGHIGDGGMGSTLRQAIRTIHQRCWQIFTIFDPYPPPSEFFYYNLSANLVNFWPLPS